MSATPEVTKRSPTRFSIRIIKLGISILYFVRNRFYCLLFPNRTGTCVVLYYHNVPSPYRKRFEQQMRIVADKKAAIDITRIDDLPANTHSIALTFDDALESFAENAVPVLVRLRIPATVFAVADAFGCNPGWGEGYYFPKERVMSCNTWREKLDAYADGELSSTDAAQVARHLRQCSRCSAMALENVQMKRSLAAARPGAGPVPRRAARAGGRRLPRVARGGQLGCPGQLAGTGPGGEAGKA